MSVSGLAIRSPWTEISEGAVSALHANPGVYEIADASGQTLLIGYAGGKSLFGLRGEVAKHIGNPRAGLFRVEQNIQCISSRQELLMAFRSATGAIPVHNAADAGLRLGQFGARNSGFYES